MTTLFTIRESDRPGNRFFVSTICLNDGGIGGAGFFPDASKARETIQAAYKTPLREVDEAAFRAARDVCQMRKGVLI